MKSQLEYVDIGESKLILAQSPTSPPPNRPIALTEEKQNIIEGYTKANIGDTYKTDEYNDLRDFIEKLDRYNSVRNELMGERQYSFNPEFDSQNPVNDPFSHEYVPRINEAALDDIQQRLDFQNRVYAYTSLGLVTVVVAGILINSSR